MEIQDTEGHIVKSYDDDLTSIDEIIQEMSALAVSQLEEALRSLRAGDAALAQKTVSGDERIDVLEHLLDRKAVEVIALRQPMGPDLRHIIAAMKIGCSLERIGDYACNIAKRSEILSDLPENGMDTIARMEAKVVEMVTQVARAYGERDAELARQVRLADESVDRLNNSLFRDILTHMAATPDAIAHSMHLLFIAKNLERAGDHATNIAEQVHIMVHGEEMKEERPKGDVSSQVMGAGE